MVPPPQSSMVPYLLYGSSPSVWFVISGMVPHLQYGSLPSVWFPTSGMVTPPLVWFLTFGMAPHFGMVRHLRCGFPPAVWLPTSGMVLPPLVWFLTSGMAPCLKSVFKERKRGLLQHETSMHTVTFNPFCNIYVEYCTSQLSYPYLSHTSG